MTQTVTQEQSETEPEIEIDKELLEEAQRHLNGVPPNEAINAALLEFVEAWHERCGRAFDRLQQMAEEDGLNFDAIEEADQ